MEHSQEDDSLKVYVGPAGLSRRQFLKLSTLGLVGIAGLMAGCGGATPAPTSGATVQSTGAATTQATSSSAGKTIRFINYVDWIGKGEYDKFRQQTGIAVQEVVINQNEQRISKLAADPTSADMLLLNLADIQRVDALGLLAKLNLDNIPNYKRVDPNFKQGLASDAAAKCMASDYGRTSFVYRTDLVKEQLKSWADVWRVAPTYSGKIIFIDLETEVIQPTLLMLGHDMNSKNQKDLQEATDALIKIKPHLKALVTADMLKPLLDGTAVIAMDWDFDASSTILKNPNVPLKWVDAEDGMRGYLDVWGAINTSKVIPEMEQFMNNHLDPQVYANFVNTLHITSIVPDATPYIDDSVKKDPVTYPPPEVSKRVTFHQYLGDAQKYYDDAWARFKSA